MNRIILNRKIIGVVLSITLLANVHETLPLSSTVEMYARFAGKSLAAATIIGIVSLPFFIKNKDKNSKTLKKQSLFKLLQISLLGGIGNTVLSHLSGKEKTSLEENKGIELQSLPAKVGPDTKTISHSWRNLLGTAVFTGFGSLCTVVFSRLSSPFKKSKKTSDKDSSTSSQPADLETKIIKKKIYQETYMHLLDATLAKMVKNEEETKREGITFGEFGTRLACLIETLEKEFKPRFNKIIDNFHADINRLSTDESKKLASQLTTLSLKLKALEELKLEALKSEIPVLKAEIAEIKARYPQPPEEQFFDAVDSGG